MARVEVVQPSIGGLGVGDRVAGRLVGSRYHHDWQPDPARGLNFAVRGGTAGVFGHDDADLLAREQRGLVVRIEGAGVEQEPDIGRQGGIARWVDGAGDVEVLGGAGKGLELQPSDGQKYPLRNRPQRFRGLGCAAYGQPMIPSLRLPCRPDDRGEGKRKPSAGLNGVCGDSRRERVRRINHRLDILVREPAGKARRAAEAASAAGDRLCARMGRAPGVGESSREAGIGGEEPGELRGLCGAAQNE